MEPGNRPPVAKIVTPSNGGSYSEGKEVTFDGMASSDPDNDILAYNWDLKSRLEGLQIQLLNKVNLALI